MLVHLYLDLPAIVSDFLLIRPGDIVVVERSTSTAAIEGVDWWAGHVIHAVGGARDPTANSLFQVVCVDTGLISIINADMVKGILRYKDIEQ